MANCQGTVAVQASRVPHQGPAHLAGLLRHRHDVLLVDKVDAGPMNLVRGAQLAIRNGPAHLLLQVLQVCVRRTSRTSDPEEPTRARPRPPPSCIAERCGSGPAALHLEQSGMLCCDMPFEQTEDSNLSPGLHSAVTTGGVQITREYSQSEIQLHPSRTNCGSRLGGEVDRDGLMSSLSTLNPI